LEAGFQASSSGVLRDFQGISGCFPEELPKNARTWTEGIPNKTITKPEKHPKSSRRPTEETLTKPEVST